MTVALRPATEADLDAAVRLFDLLHQLQLRWRVFRPRPTLSEETLARYRAAIGEPDSLLLVAEEDERLIGMGLGHPGTPSQVSDERAFELANVVVVPERRGEGIGTSIGEALLRFGRERGFATFTLRTFAGNEAAVRLWQGLGFRPVWVQMVASSDPVPSTDGVSSA